jgi:hypothetical protein
MPLQGYITYNKAALKLMLPVSLVYKITAQFILPGDDMQGLSNRENKVSKDYLTSAVSYTL